MSSLRLQDFKFNKIYRVNSKVDLPYDIKERNSGSAVFVLSPNTDKLVEFLTSPYINSINYHDYHIDKYVNYKLNNSIVKYSNDQQVIFKNKIVGKTTLTKNVMTMEQATGRNLVYDITHFNSDFFSRKSSRAGLFKVNLYINSVLDNILLQAGTSTLYPMKTLIIPLDQWLPNMQDLSVYKIQNIENPFTIIYNKILHDPIYFNKFNGWKFVFTNVNEFFVLDPAIITADTAKIIKTLISRMKSKPSAPSLEDVEELNTNADDTIVDTSTTELTEEKLTEIIPASIVSKMSSQDINIIGKSASTLSELPDNDPEINKILQNAIDHASVPVSPTRLARLTKLCEEEKNLKLGDLTLTEIRARANANLIDPIKVDIDVINKDMAVNGLESLNKGYNDKLMDYDLQNIITSFSKKDKPLFIVDMEKTDTSDTFNKKFTYKFTFEDVTGRRHTVKVDMPKFVNERFFYLNGNKKILFYQQLPLPVTKTDPDTVQVSSSYNKIFIKRQGTNISPLLTRLFKVFGAPIKNVNVTFGNSAKINNAYITTMDYSSISSKINTITIGRKITLYFNQDTIRELIKTKNLTKSKDDKLIPIGIGADNNIIYMDNESEMIQGANLKLIDYIIEEIDKVSPGFKSLYAKTNPGTRFVYSRASIMARKIPLVILLGFLEGIESVMSKGKIEHYFSEKRPVLSDDEKLKKGIVQFANGYLVYDLYPFANSLLMNGLSEIPTKEYNYTQFMTKEVYFDLFEALLGRRNIGNAFENFYQLMIDPITEEILIDNHMPTDFVSLLLFANRLLEDKSCSAQADVSDVRYRLGEMVNVHLYKALVDSYERYRLTANNRNPEKMSLKQDAVIKDLMMSPICEDYSTLNPIYEADKTRIISQKGPNGLNLSRAYTISKRSYHKSMVGVVSQATPPSASVGVVRQLPVDSNIVSLRGYVKTSTDEEVKDLPATKFFTPSEMLVSLAGTHDDPNRLLMVSTQSKHTVGTVDSDRMLVGTGYEKAMPLLLSDDFAFKSKKAGIVEKVDTKNGIMILKYDDGTHEDIDISGKVEKNGGGGFYIENKLNPVMEVGEKVIPKSIVAINGEFFDKTATGEIVYKPGPMANVAIIHSSFTFEDSLACSERISEKMSSYLVMKEDVTLGKNSNIEYMVKVGDKVKVGSPLVIYDESYDDEFTNKMLASLKSDAESLKDMKTPIASHYNGEITDIKIYYTVPFDQLSPTLQTIVKNYNKGITVKEKIISSYKIEDSNVIKQKAEMVKTDMNGKIKGVKVGEGILIEFYVKFKDKFGIGDKCTSSTALKGINQDIYPEGQEPFLASDPNTKIDIYLGFTSIMARMTNSITIVGGANRVLLDLKTKMQNIYEAEFGKIE
jgi:hypothetical protein